MMDIEVEHQLPVEKISATLAQNDRSEFRAIIPLWLSDEIQ